jgi:NADH-quinone oxidoreductase subunit G
VAFLNPRRFELMFPVAGYVTTETDMLGELTALVHAAAGVAGKPVPAGTGTATVTDAHKALIAALSHGTRRALILGTLAQRHPAYSQLKALSVALAELCGASFGCITEGANAAGAYLAGAVPHREPGGAPISAEGLSARQMLDSPLKAYVLFGGIDPASDLGVDPWALASADLVIAVTTHLPEALRGVAHVVLPIGSFAETSGTYVNAEGRWQSWAGAAKLPGESRPGWKVLRVLANLLNLRGVDYNSSDEVRDALKSLCGTRIEAGPVAAGGAIPNGAAASGSWVDIPPYQSDMLVRGSEPLQKTKDGRMTRSVI